MSSAEGHCQVRIDDMTLGPYGVGRAHGKALLVANAAPGDVLDVSITGDHRDYSVARLENIAQSSPARRSTPCPFLPRCGGCDWQQLSYQEQVAAKGRLIAECSFHHSADYHRDLRRRCRSSLEEPAAGAMSRAPAALTSVQIYVRNVATWLALLESDELESAAVERSVTALWRSSSRSRCWR